MDIDADIRIAIRKGLLSAFRGRSDFDRMVRQGLSKNLNEIAAEKVGLDATVDALLTWAESEDRVPALLRAAHEENPGNLELLAAVRMFAEPVLRFQGMVLRLASASPALPERPYPLLQPYTHPATFTGRDGDLLEVLDELRLPLVLCLHGASGAGKSSFLQAGVLPRLRSDGVPVVVNRRPDEPGIARRLAAGLLELPEGSRLGDEDLQGFVHLLGQVEKLASTAPVIVLDQFEDVFRRSEDGSALARVGPLLAATTELAMPDGRGFRCRWVLSYRQEYHGQVVAWLRDVLSDARARKRPGLQELPHDLSRQDYLREMPLGPLGVASSEDEAKAVFLRAIKVPLALADEKSGALRYPYRFDGDGAERLALVFAGARMDQPRAPLLPELQVVLDELLRAAVRGSDGVFVVKVPHEVGDLVTNAIGRHLEETLKKKFQGDDARRLRALALLTLRELADAEGKRRKGIPPKELEAKLGASSTKVLEALQDARLLVKYEEHGSDGDVWVLPHDRLAKVVVGIWNDAAKRRSYELDEEVIELQSKVRLRVELQRQGDPAGTELPEALFMRVEALRGNLLWDDACEAWWTTCVAQRQERRSRRLRGVVRSTISVGAALLVVTGSFLLGSYWPGVAVDKLSKAANIEIATAARDELKRYPWRTGEAERLFEERVGDLANPYFKELGATQDFHDAWAAYKAVVDLPGQKTKADQLYSEFMIRKSIESARDHEFDRALLQRLKADTFVSSKENLREAAYLASLFANRKGSAKPPASKDARQMPLGTLPVASITGFVGDFVMEKLFASTSPPTPRGFCFWNTSNGKKSTILFRQDDVRAWMLLKDSVAKVASTQNKSLFQEILTIADRAPGAAASCVRDVAREIRTAMSRRDWDKLREKKGDPDDRMRECFPSEENRYIVTQSNPLRIRFNLQIHEKNFDDVDGIVEKYSPKNLCIDPVFSEDGKFARCYRDGGHIVESASGRLIGDGAVDVEDVAFSRTGDRVAALESADDRTGALGVYATADGQKLASLPLPEQAQLGQLGLYMSPAGSLVWIGDHGFYDTNKASDVCADPKAFPHGSLVAVNDRLRRSLLATGNNVALWDIDNCSKKGVLQFKFSVRWLAFAPDSAQAAVIDERFAVHFIKISQDGMKLSTTRLVVAPGNRELPRDWTHVNWAPKGGHAGEDGVMLDVLGTEPIDDPFPEGFVVQRITRNLPDDFVPLANPLKEIGAWQTDRKLLIKENGEVVSATAAPIQPPAP